MRHTGSLLLLLASGTALADLAPPTPPAIRRACANGSTTDCNARGATLRRDSAFVDLAPPAGWVQCAGFINTDGDDVSDDFAASCLRTTRLRLRVFTTDGALEEDVYVEQMRPRAAWPDDYLAGDHRHSNTVVVKATHWIRRNNLSFFTHAGDGHDACMLRAAPSGMTLGGGWSEMLLIAPGARDGAEYRISCGGKNLLGRRIALYR